MAYYIAYSRKTLLLQSREFWKDKRSYKIYPELFKNRVKINKEQINKLLNTTIEIEPETNNKKINVKGVQANVKLYVQEYECLDALESVNESYQSILEKKTELSHYIPMFNKINQYLAQSTLKNQKLYRLVFFKYEIVSEDCDNT